MGTFEWLNGALAAWAFRHMTFPSYQHWLTFEPGRPMPLALAVRSADDPVGLALTVGVTADEARLLSVFVEKSARRQGLGTELVQRTSVDCARRGIAKLTATYLTSPAEPAPIEGLFARAGWSEPQTRMLVVHCSIDSISPAPWMKPSPLPPGYEIVPWAELTAEDREELRQSNARAPWIPRDLDPFDFETGLEPITSLALRVHGKILGWCLTHVVGGTLRYTCSFVRADLQRLGRILFLYRETVARAPRAGMSVGMWTVPVHHERMANFARQHLRPYSIFFGETRGVEKPLGGGASARPVAR